MAYGVASGLVGSERWKRDRGGEGAEEARKGAVRRGAKDKVREKRGRGRGRGRRGEKRRRKGQSEG